MAESDCPHCKKLLRIIEKEEISYNRCLESPNAAKVLCYDCNLYLCSKCNTSHPCTHKILYIDTTPALEIPQQVIECCGEPWGIAINKNGSKWAVADLASNFCTLWLILSTTYKLSELSNVIPSGCLIHQSHHLCSQPTGDSDHYHYKCICGGWSLLTMYM